MAELVLGEAEQSALRTLIATDPVPGPPVPPAAVLETVTALIPCDAIGVHILNPSSRTVEEVSLPGGSGTRSTGRRTTDHPWWASGTPRPIPASRDAGVGRTRRTAGDRLPQRA